MPLLPSERKGLGALIEGAKINTTASFSVMRTKPVGAELRDFTLESYMPAVNGRRVILDQGATSSCVAHAFIIGIHIMECRAGLTYLPASRLYAYYHARREMGAGSIVLDTGTYLRTCASGLRKFGVPDEQWWEWSQFSLTVNRRPNFKAMAEAHPRAGGRYVKIYEVGRDRTYAIKSAIASGYPVAFGTRLGVSFLDNRGPKHVTPPPDTEAIAGNHAMTIIGWETDASDREWFRVVNSWGPNWRDEGLCWMSREYIEWMHSHDFHVIHGWKRITERL